MSTEGCLRDSADLYAVVLVDERSLSGSVCTNCLNGLEYQDFHLCGTLIVDSDLLCAEIRSLIDQQIKDVPKSYVFISKEGWPLNKTYETRLKLSSLISNRNLIALKKVYEKPRIGIVIEKGDCVGSIFFDFTGSLFQLRKEIDKLAMENGTKLSGLEYRFIDRNGWPLLKTQEEQLFLMDIVSFHNIQIRVQRVTGSLDPMITEHADDLNEKVTYQDSTIDTIKSFNDDSSDGWRRGSKKRSIIKRATLIRRNRSSELQQKEHKSGKTIMISYCRNEAFQHAQNLKAELIACGFSVYLDKDEIKTGTDWADALNEAVKNCEVFVPLVTQLYGRTQWTNREVKLADLLNKKIVPINFLSYWPPECLAIQFATTQYIPWNIAENEIDSKMDFSNYKAWPESCAKRIATKISDEISRSSSIVKSASEPTDDRLIAISVHPNQESIVKKIKVYLKEQSFHIWSSIEIDDRDAVDSGDINPNFLPTIQEANESFSNDCRRTNHQSISRRPLSCPTEPQLSEKLSKRAVRRQTSTVSSSSTWNCLDPEKLKKFKEFHEKVKNAGLVIIIASKAYFQSKTSQQHVYYCEQRKHMIVVKAEDCDVPPWFTNLYGEEKPIDATKECFLPCLSGRINRILNPFSKTDVWELQEAKIQYLINYMRKNLPHLDTCVYFIGNSFLNNQRSETLCKAIGKELTKVEGITVVTCGFYGASDILARAFYEERKRIERREKSNKNKTCSSVIHVLPLKDHQNFSKKCKQLDDGTFEPLSYGKTIFLGESMKERDTAIARLLDTCILIEGGPGEGHEPQEFLWNDHYVIPINSMDDCENGKLPIPPQIFDRPPPVDPKDWSILENQTASPEIIGKAAVRIIMEIKKSIAEQRLAEPKNKSKLKNRSFKKNAKKPEKLDIEIAKSSKTPALDDQSPRKILPFNGNFETKAKKSRWRLSSVIKFYPKF